LEYVRSKYALGYLYKNLAMYNKAIQNYKTGIEVAKASLNTPGMLDPYKRLLNGTGLAYYYLGSYDSALLFHFESLNVRNQESNQMIERNEIFDSDNNPYENIAVAENNIGLVYLKIRDYDEAINFFNRAIENKKRAGTFEINFSLVNLGLSYVYSYNNPQDERFLKAVDIFTQLLDSCNVQKDCSSGVLYESYNALGILSLNIDSLDRARKYFEQALVYSKEEADLGKRLHVLHNIASVYEESGKYSDAIEILIKGQDWADSLNLLPLRANNYRRLASVYHKAGEHNVAYEYFLKYDSIQEAIFSDVVINGIKNLLVDQNQRTNVQKINEQADRIQVQEKAQLYLMVIIILAFVILFIVIYNSRQRQKVNLKLSDANKIIEEKNSQLQNVNISLEEKVRDRTKELKRINEALKQSNMELDNFIYKTSHDIRGPLATLQGICNVALLDVQDEKAIDYLDKLNGTATKLNEILSKLLIINQINNSVISQAPIQLEEIVQQVIQENLRKSNEKHIETRINIEENLIFRSDEDLLRIIIGNLVNNAFKFYKKSFSVASFVSINIYKNNIHLFIEVTDNGVGIDEKAHNKIFEIFSKATEMSDSAGLGLYLVKLSVEKLKGSIKLVRSQEGYTNFKVIIPFQVNGKS
jgi:signal transduction histidine kinase